VFVDRKVTEFVDNQHGGLEVAVELDSTPALLGVIDSGPKKPSVDPSATTAVGSHSVAADSETNLVYVPIRGNTAVPGSGAVCSKATDAFGLAGSDAKDIHQNK
jgi:hypothetical protein